MKPYPVFRKENIPAYVVVLLVWVFISLLSALSMSLIAEDVAFWKAILWAAATTMAGILIMFVASLLKLRKLSPGFRRLAQGDLHPDIPPVWWPVLTAATNAALELAGRMAHKNRKE